MGVQTESDQVGFVLGELLATIGYYTHFLILSSCTKCKWRLVLGSLMIKHF